MDAGTQAALEIWKTTIDLQKHFNDLSMRVRGLAITVLGGFLGAAGYALNASRNVVVAATSIPLTTLILFAALICWSAFYLMDRLWYHRLLTATVAHGQKVEAALMTDLPIIGLTRCINDASPIYGLKARHRLSIFYGFFGALLYTAAGIYYRAPLAFFITGALVAFGIFLLEFFSNRSG